MFELMAFLVVVGLVVGAVALVGFVLKLLFKLALLPFWLLWVAFKVVLGIVGGVLLLAVAGPVVLVLGLVVLIPLAILALLIWGAAAVVA